MAGARTRGDQKSLRPYLGSMSVGASRAGRSRVRGEVFVPGAVGGSGGGVEPAADRRSCRRCLGGSPWGRIGAGGYIQTAEEIGAARSSVGAAQTHWGKSGRSCLQIGMESLSELFVRAPVDGTGWDVELRRRHLLLTAPAGWLVAGWAPVRRRAMRGVVAVGGVSGAGWARSLNDRRNRSYPRTSVQGWTRGGGQETPSLSSSPCAGKFKERSPRVRTIRRFS
jgi:hypothetical protein